jgi:hypothetical protein
VSGDHLWAVERTINLNMKSSAKPTATLALTRVRLADLLEDGPAIPLEGVATDAAPELLVAGERLWVLGSSAAAYYEKGALKRLPVAKRPARASRAFVYEGRPAVITLGATPELAVLQDDADAKWVMRRSVLSQLS